ncbi:hypothetical protein L218DRAFT_1010691, partial [Marasmius fiardii PR-910]
MLFNKLVTVSAVATLAAATAIPRDGGRNLCFEQVQTVDQATSSSLGAALKLLGIDLGDITGLV